MPPSIHLAVMALLSAACLFAPHPAQAETTQTCTGFIDSLPATIATQGTWCLRANLGTAMASGNAITIATNNVTIDCNDYKIGGLAAGEASTTFGISADGRQNVTVRHCNIRGFYRGIAVNSGAGHLVEDNRLDNNLAIGIQVTGDNNRIRRNAVYDTGGATGATVAYGIYARASVADNTVAGLFADAPAGFLAGIRLLQSGDEARRNTVSGFDMTSRQGGSVTTAYGVYLSNGYQRASGNHIVAGGPANGYGIFSVTTTNACLDNSVGGFTTNIDSDCAQSGNLTMP